MSNDTHKRVKFNGRIRSKRADRWVAAAEAKNMTLGEFMYWAADQASTPDARSRYHDDRRTAAKTYQDIIADLAQDLGDLGNGIIRPKGRP